VFFDGMTGLPNIDCRVIFDSRVEARPCEFGAGGSRHGPALFFASIEKKTARKFHPRAFAKSWKRYMNSKYWRA